MYFIALAELLIQVKAGQIVGLLLVTLFHPVGSIAPTPASIDRVHQSTAIVNILGIQLGLDLVCNQLGFHPPVLHGHDYPGYCPCTTETDRPTDPLVERVA